MKKNLMQLGRSMVEMLGVLAIIGVLSIVGIQGYKRAMLQMKANQAWESIQKFKTEVFNDYLVNPRDCGGTSTNLTEAWYYSAPSYDAIKDYPSTSGTKYRTSYCPLDVPDILPDFANGSIDNFYVFVNRDASRMQFRNINVNGLCRILLSPETIPNATSEYMQVNRDGVQYRCYRGSTDIEW